MCTNKFNIVKTLLLLHGAIGAKDQLEPLAEHLKGQFDVHNINFSGHGGTPFDGLFSIEKFAGEVTDYLRENKLEKVSVFGYSMGGYVALYLASIHPEKVESIFTLATKFDWSPEISQKETNMLNPEIIKEKIPAFAKALQQRHHPQSWEMVLEKTSQLMLDLGIKQPLEKDDFNKIKIPVKLTIGDGDKMVSIAETRQVSEWLPNAALLILPDVQHPIEKAPTILLAEEIKAFLK
tara:strand:- start:102532 stop:103239 length:708 start_codon:yes stop_codon:yes gene_type:complete